MEIPEGLTETQYLTRLMHRCGHVLYHQSRAGQQQDAVLRILHDNGPMTQKALQERLAIQPGSVSELVTKLENKALITRRKDTEDRRRVVLTLTEKGASAKRDHPAYPEEHLFDTLSDEERRALTGILQKLLDAWKR
ncbi:MAG: MarR family transcriptional regulator [Firmicutes bacterium]|nr:MarR family transcriptional regulator [Bacillota bacterium]